MESEKVPERLRASRLLITGILMVLGLSCAVQVPPSGGPPDTIPPQIIASDPAPGTLHFRGSRFTLRFSEYVDRRSVEESIFISPSVGTLEFDWGSTDVDITFRDSLRPSTTYILTVGTDVIDKRNRNRMENAFSIPFSTGESIDSGVVTGRVDDVNPEGIMIFAYQLDSRDTDTLNPSHVRPDYLTQTGKDGSFVLPYLALGRYRVIAMRDEYKNLLYDVQTDAYGVSVPELHITTDRRTQSGVQFRLTRDDTTRPFLSSVRALNRMAFLLKFSEEIQSGDHANGSVVIEDTVTRRPLAVEEFSFLGTSRSEWWVRTSSQEPGRVYRITVRDVRDTRGNMINPLASSGIVSGSGEADTLRPVLTVNIADSMTTFLPTDTMRLVFSEPVVRSAFGGGFVLRDSADGTLDGELRWSGSSLAFFFPRRPPVSGAWYTMMVKMDSVVDYSGNGYRDTLLVRRFRIQSEAVSGRIVGYIIDEDTAARGAVHLTAVEVAAKPRGSKPCIVERPGPFVYDGITEGNYTLRAFRDADGNGVYSHGEVFPFASAEKFTVYKDTLRIRARWPLEGVVVRFR